MHRHRHKPQTSSQSSETPSVSPGSLQPGLHLLEEMIMTLWLCYYFTNTQLASAQRLNPTSGVKIQKQFIKLIINFINPFILVRTSNNTEHSIISYNVMPHLFQACPVRAACGNWAPLWRRQRKCGWVPDRGPQPSAPLPGSSHNGLCAASSPVERGVTFLGVFFFFISY